MALGDLRGGLVLYWDLDEASGTRDDNHGAFDLTDNNTVTQAAGKISNAALFTAANSEYLSRVSSAEIQLADKLFTLSCWVYLISLPTLGGSFTILSKQEEAYLYVQNLAGDTVIRFDGVSLTVESTTILTTSTWYHVAISQNPIQFGTEGGIKLYINGVLESENGGPTPLSTTANPLYLGRDESGAYLDGRLDEMGLWTGLNLNDQEIRDLYNNGAGLAYPLTTGPQSFSRARGVR